MAKFVLLEEASAPLATTDAVVVYSLSGDPDNVLYAKSTGVTRVLGNFPSATATDDLGTSTNKWRDGYFSRNITIGGTLGVTGVATFATNVIVSAGGITVTGNSTIAGTLTSSVSTAGQHSIAVRNTNAAAFAIASLLLGNNTSASLGSVDVFGSAYTPTGLDDLASGMRILGTGVGGISYRASDAAGTHRWYSGTTNVLHIAAGGGVTLPVGGLTLSVGAAKSSSGTLAGKALGIHSTGYTPADETAGLIVAYDTTSGDAGSQAIGVWSRNGAITTCFDITHTGGWLQAVISGGALAIQVTDSGPFDINWSVLRLY